MVYTPISLIDNRNPQAYSLFMSTKTHIHTNEEKNALKVRLRKIAGQLKGIEKMIDDDRECPEILTQVVSARKALKSFAEKVIHEHLHHCIEGAQQDQGRKKLRELLDVLERYVE